MSTFNLTRALEELIADIVGRVSQFDHVDPSRILVCVTTTRGGGVQGMYAKIHPLRFAGGVRSREVRRGRRRFVCTMPSISHRGSDLLYIIYFLAPRFFNLPPREKLITVFHELYHISPRFDGDIRRFPGRNYAHGASRKQYNALMGEFVDAYLRQVGSEVFPELLARDMATLRAEYTVLVGRKYPAPKMEIHAGDYN
jgi:hypothetical protein